MSFSRSMSVTAALSLAGLLALASHAPQGASLPRPAARPRLAPRLPAPVTEQGALSLTLSDAAPPAPESVPGPAPATDLPADQAAALLALLPAPPAEPAREPETTRLPPASLPPPRAGLTVLAPFPPPGAPEGPPPAPAPGPLALARHAPDGEVEAAAAVTLAFSRAMVPLADIGVLAAAAVPATLEPQPSGRWRWLDTRTLLFEAEGGRRLPAATRYEVLVPAGTRALDGSALEADARFTFSTPAPRVLRAMPDGGPASLRPVVAALFDQQVDAAAVARLARAVAGPRAVTLEQVDLGREGDADAASVLAWLGEDRRDRAVALRFARDLPASAEVRVTLPAGTPSAEGPRGMEKAHEIRFRTRGPLRLVSSACGWGGQCWPGQPWRLEFTNPLDASSLDEGLVRVTPALPGLRVRASGSELWIEGDSAPRTRYQVRVAPRLADVFGQQLASEVRADFTTQALGPRLEMPGAPLVVLPAGGPARLSVFSSGVPKLRIRTWRVEPANWSAACQAVRSAQGLEGAELTLPFPARETTASVPADAPGLIETQVDLAATLGGPTGHVMVCVDAPERARGDGEPRLWAVAWAQVTGLGLDALIDQSRLVAWATDLATGAPADGTRLELVPETGEGSAIQFADDGGIARFVLGEAEAPARMLLARRGQDVAFLPESPWWSGPEQRSTWRRQAPASDVVLHVLDDRGVYRPGETARVKGFARRIDRSPRGGVSLSSGDITWRLRDPLGNEIARGQAALSGLGAFDLSLGLPEGMNLGYSTLEMSAGPDATAVHALRVEEFRRPEYEVSAEASAGPHVVSQHAKLTARASYYGGGALGGAPVEWALTARPASFHPPGWDGFTFGRWRPWWMSWRGGPETPEPGQAWSHDGLTDARGEHRLDVSFDGVTPPQSMLVEAEAVVRDVNRQAWAARTTLMVHPSSLHAGLRLPRAFVERGQRLRVEAIVTDADGLAVARRVVAVRATRPDSAGPEKGGAGREAAVECRIVSELEPRGCELQLDAAGAWTITGRVEDESGRATETTAMAWVTGRALAPDRQAREAAAELIPETPEAVPGEVARLLVRSPFAPARGVLTLARGGLLLERAFAMEDAQHVLEVEVEPGWEPAVTASVLLTGGSAGQGPLFASATVVLPVRLAAHRLAVTATPREAVLQPGHSTTIDVTAATAEGAPARGEVTVIVADEAVLALTGYQVADPLLTFFPQRGSSVREERMRRHVLLPGTAHPAADTSGMPILAADSGMEMLGGARFEAMASLAKSAPGEPPATLTLRGDFAPLALFAPALALDEKGRASVTLKLPDSVTRWRIVAIAASGASRFGTAQSSLVARQELTLRPSPPRFLNAGDRLELPLVVQNLADHAVVARVGARVTGGALEGPAAREVKVSAGGRVELRFPVSAPRAGTMRLQAIAEAGGLRDAVALAWPVLTPASAEAFAVRGVLDAGSVAQPLQPPRDALPDVGGLELTTSSTALSELGDAVIYLEEYPFACSEQLASRLLGILALRDAVRAFAGIPDEAALDRGLARDLATLLERQRPDGSFGFWRRDGERQEWPYVSVHATHALVRARAAGLPVSDDALARALAFTRRVDMTTAPSCGVAVRATIAAHALHVRQVAGEAAPAQARAVLREAGKDLPLEALAWLAPVVAADPRARAEASELRQRLLSAVTETAGAATLATSRSELGEDAYLVLHSSRRVDGIGLESLLDLADLIGPTGDPDLEVKLVRGLLDHRVAGRWSNTQENAFTLLALGRYFRAREKAAPDFVATAWLAGKPIQRESFRGRATDRRLTRVPMSDLAALGESPGVVLSKEGPGRLYWRLGLRYWPKSAALPPLEQGLRVERSYEAVNDPSDVTRAADGSWRIRAGALVRLRVRVGAPARRTHVAVIDPLPAGLEIVNAGLATSQQVQGTPPGGPAGLAAWLPAPWSWADHENLRDDRAESFAAVLSAGEWEQSHVARATTPGRFLAPPARAEEMYAPETFGRSATDLVIIE